ncbi:hypothetical protein O181_063724 [Austropuccinia psidii MF-1]|uniref:Uncharacterized protein n=1 Tax=Austropuccinia psidii MF-1 TaxID=1389203 RepID=A0A9Q3EMP3_9BASI|nr:hypothetical protein [Austropuccinia psidii MF-1]
MENKQQQVKPTFTLGRTWSRLPEDIFQRDTVKTPYCNHKSLESQQAVQTPAGKGSQDKGELSHYPSHKRTTEPDSAYSVFFRLTGSKLIILPSGFMPFMHQQICDQDSPLFTIPGTFQGKTRIKKKKRDFFQPEAEPVSL